MSPVHRSLSNRLQPKIKQTYHDPSWSQCLTQDVRWHHLLRLDVSIGQVARAEVTRGINHRCPLPAVTQASSSRIRKDHWSRFPRHTAGELHHQSFKHDWVFTPTEGERKMANDSYVGRHVPSYRSPSEWYTCKPMRLRSHASFA
jgi:hypothetical protein